MVAKKKKSNNNKKKKRSRTLVSSCDDRNSAKNDSVPPSFDLKKTCYHGSTAQNFSIDGEYVNAFLEWTGIMRKSSKKSTVECISKFIAFRQHHLNLMNNPEFVQCIFAFATDFYLKLSDDQTRRNTLQDILLLGITYKYGVVGTSHCDEKNSKYSRDINTERGIINCLTREIPCDCMDSKKAEAKTMEKLSICYGCSQQFPKSELRPCSGCHQYNFCSNECLKKAWPRHKFICNTRANNELRKKVDQKLNNL